MVVIAINQFDFVGLILVLIMVICGLANRLYEVYRNRRDAIKNLVSMILAIGLPLGSFAVVLWVLAMYF